MSEFIRKNFDQTMTLEKCKDTGMAFALVSIILSYVFKSDYWMFAAFTFLVITMCAAVVLKPAAKIWFGLSHIFGTIMSKILLSTIFYAVVTPVAVIRRLIKKDTLRLCEFKKSSKSVMDERKIIYGPKDIARPF
jgi:hypothetical protein